MIVTLVLPSERSITRSFTTRALWNLTPENDWARSMAVHIMSLELSPAAKTFSNAFRAGPYELVVALAIRIVDCANHVGAT